MRPRRQTLAALLVCAVGAAGCESGDNAGTTLSHPIYPSCGIASFAAPRATAANGKTKRWQITYLLPARALTQSRPGDTTNVLILERAPTGARGNVKGGQERVIAGRKVSLKAPTGTLRSYVAQWKTMRARYLMLTNGRKPDVLEQIVGCLA